MCGVEFLLPQVVGMKGCAIPCNTSVMQATVGYPLCQSIMSPPKNILSIYSLLIWSVGVVLNFSKNMYFEV